MIRCGRQGGLAGRWVPLGYAGFRLGFGGLTQGVSPVFSMFAGTLRCVGFSLFVGRWRSAAREWQKGSSMPPRLADDKPSLIDYSKLARNGSGLGGWSVFVLLGLGVLFALVMGGFVCARQIAGKIGRDCGSRRPARGPPVGPVRPSRHLLGSSPQLWQRRPKHGKAGRQNRGEREKS